MSRAELQQPAIKPLEVQRWASSETDEESEIVAQFLVAPYPCQSDQLNDGQEQYHGLGDGTGGIGECGSIMYWPLGHGGCYWPSSGCYYLGEPDVSIGINTLSCSTSIDLNLAGEEEIRSECARPVPDPSTADHRVRAGTGCFNGGNDDGSATAPPPLQPKRKVQDGQEGGGIGRPKKKARACVQKQGKKAVSKTVQKCSSSGSYCSDNEYNCSQHNGRTEDHVAGGGGSGNARSPAGRGLATDPQSLYAKRRREKINDRLRILQKLVPNGTKVDISTMLEEAVLYVKFLQQQIKVNAKFTVDSYTLVQMLSSDDLWMYAPIAYNGMSLGIDFRIPLPQ